MKYNSKSQCGTNTFLVTLLNNNILAKMEKMSIMMKIYVQSNPRSNTTGFLILGLLIVLCLAHRSISPRYIVDY